MSLKKLRYISLLIPILILVLALPVMAATANPWRPVTGLPVASNLTSLAGVGLEPQMNTFYAHGRVWIFYEDTNSNIVYKSGVPGEALSSAHVVAPTTSLYADEFCVWYEDATDTVHYARQEFISTDAVYYRMGTPNNAGVITWAAPEQTVAVAYHQLWTWPTVIAVDETHNPWIAWVDTNNVTAVSIIYLESSTTHNGTWTQNTNVSSNWSIEDPALNLSACWVPNLCPIGATSDLMHLGWSSTNLTAGSTLVYGVTFNVSGNTSGIQQVSPTAVYATRQWAFDFYDVIGDVWCVYTNTAGDIMGGWKNATATWAASVGNFDYVKENGGTHWFPSLSGYAVNGTGESMLCFAHNEDAIYSGIHYYGQPVVNWTWTLAWVETDLSDTLSRLNSAYKYSSPISFTWQDTDDSDTPDTDDVYLWWQDNSNDQIGYYSPRASTAGSDILRIMIPIAVAIGVVLAVMALIGTSDWSKWVAAGVIGAVVFYAVLQLVNTLL